MKKCWIMVRRRIPDQSFDTVAMVGSAVTLMFPLFSHLWQKANLAAVLCCSYMRTLHRFKQRCVRRGIKISCVALGNDDSVLHSFCWQVLPLLKRGPIRAMASDLFASLAAKGCVDYDESGSIGRRYRRHDEIGTPLCITVDGDSPDDGQVTIRCRDTLRQIRVPVDELTSLQPHQLRRSHFAERFG